MLALNAITLNAVNTAYDHDGLSGHSASFHILTFYINSTIFDPLLTPPHYISQGYLIHAVTYTSSKRMGVNLYRRPSKFVCGDIAWLVIKLV